MDIFNIDLPPGLESAITSMEKRFLMMRSSGSSIRDISKKLKKSTHTICDWNKKFSKELLIIRNSEFCELQKKIIETKSSRLDFIKSEIDRLSKILKKQEMVNTGPLWDYRDSLNLFVRLSDLLSNYESEMLAVGVKFKDNIEPEINLNENKKNDEIVADVAVESNSVAENIGNETIDNKELKTKSNKTATNCNTATPRKYEAYKKH